MTDTKKFKSGLPLVFLVIAFCSLFAVAFVFLYSRTNPSDKKVQSSAYKTAGFMIPSFVPTEPQKTVSLIFTGDVIPARSVNSTMTRLKNFKLPFEKIESFLKAADLTIINLEAPLIKNCPLTDAGMVFCGNERFIEGLISAGVDIAGLANNHTSNYAKAGVDNTIRLLTENGIDTVGVDDIVYRNVNGVNFAFIAFNGVVPLVDYLSTIDKVDIRQKIIQAKANADFVTILYHWGKEYTISPQKDSGVAPDDPIEIGRFSIDSGADLVVGNHPHVIQGYEYYKDKLIFYALGNTVFDQMWSTGTRTGVILQLELIGSAVLSYSFYPIFINNFYQPEFLTGEQKETVLSGIERYY